MKEEFIELLKSTNREGMDKLLAWIEKSDFYKAPASTRFHGSYEGGLLEHSLNVYKVLKQKLTQFPFASILNINDNGMMGYLDIPKIDIKVPIYHGTSNEVLQKGVGHLEGSSFPVGGESTHSVLSAHSGLPSARLFTDLNQLKVGDMFYIYILDQVFAYKVDQVLVVEPADVDALDLQKGEDYVTLVTCTPYAVNTHRLLVRGTRVEYSPEVLESISVEKKLGSDDIILYSSLFIVFIILLLVVIFSIKDKKKKQVVVADTNVDINSATIIPQASVNNEVSTVQTPVNVVSTSNVSNNSTNTTNPSAVEELNNASVVNTSQTVSNTNVIETLEVPSNNTVINNVEQNTFDEAKTEDTNEDTKGI